MKRIIINGNNINKFEKLAHSLLRLSSNMKELHINKNVDLSFISGIIRLNIMNVNEVLDELNLDNFDLELSEYINYRREL
jgi:2-polyprenyl-3-methyl-5-hydroxy-6-metoxy-1,4-benzoquinol methylase